MAFCRSIFASWPVRKKLLAVSMILFLGVSAVILSLGLEKRKESIEKARERALLIVDGLAVRQKATATGARCLLSALAGDSSVQRREAAFCNDLFSQLHALYPSFTVIEAATSRGVVFASSASSRIGEDLSGRRDVRDAIRCGRFSVGDLRGRGADGDRSIDFSYPVLNKHGGLVAVLTAECKVGGRTDFDYLERMHPPAGFSIHYADRKGIRIWRQPAGKTASPGSSPEVTGVDLIRANSDRGLFEETGNDGVLRIYAYRGLRLEQKAPPCLYIIGDAPVSAIAAQANRAITVELLAAGAACALALALTLFFGDLSLVRPIAELTAAAQRLGRGEESVRTGLPHIADEFGRLAEAFDSMAELLEKKNAERQNAQEALTRAYTESEALVLERTCELSNSNAALRAEIAERKLAEEERKFLMAALEQSADAILITDTDWIIRYVNPAFTMMTGYEGAEAIGRHTRFLKSGLHSRAFYRDIQETLCAGRVWSGYVTNRKKDGSFYETEASVSPVRSESGTVMGFVSAHRDISLRLKLEKELRQAHKMEALGTLAGGIAHDFNNILAAMLGHAEAALGKLPQESPVCENLQNVLKAGARAADLVKRILAFSRRAEHSRRPVAIASLVEETLTLMGPTFPANIEIRTDLPSCPDEMIVEADPTEIQQVLINLCTNAVHAMSKGGGVLLIGLSRVDVSSAGEFEGPRPVPASDRPLRPGPYICLVVSDTGRGIDPSIQEKIFDPYFTTKPADEGTGLGLSVVRGIVRSYGGGITVRSTPGSGATFAVFLRTIDI
ncbi:MAG: PAS domain S-box protein [Syntrophobacteraceae bacterium]